MQEAKDLVAFRGDCKDENSGWLQNFLRLPAATQTIVEVAEGGSVVERI